MQSLKEFFTSFSWSVGSVLKGLLLLVLGVIALAFVLGIIGGVWRQAGSLVGMGGGYGGDDMYYAHDGGGIKGVVQTVANSLGANYDYAEESMASGRAYPGIAPEPPYYGEGGADAEEYEVQEYSARYEKSNPEETCSVVLNLKERDDVIFDSSGTSERDGSCYYSFRAERGDAEEDVVAILRDLDPKEWNANVYTIERSVGNTEFEIELLEDQFEQIETTIEETEDAYAELVVLATRQGDTESLATLISDKLNLLDRLSERRANVASQLARYERSGGQQLERIDYAHFDVSVIEDKIVDWKSLADSWERALEDFVRTVNQTVQNIVIGIFSFALIVVQWLLYLGIILVAAKFAWIAGRYIWAWQWPNRKK